MMGGIINDAINSVFDRIGGFFTGWFDWLFSPLWLWWGIGVGVFLAICVVAFFLPFKWVRASLGAILVVGGAFLAGGTIMYREVKGKLDEEQRKRKEAERLLKQRQNQQGSGNDGWRWPFGVLLLFVLIPSESRAQYEFTCDGLHQAVQNHGQIAVRRWAVSEGYTTRQINSAVAKCRHRTNSRVTHTGVRRNGR